MNTSPYGRECKLLVEARDPKATRLWRQAANKGGTRISKEIRLGGCSKNAYKQL